MLMNFYFWGLGIGPIPNPQSPIPNPQSPKNENNFLNNFEKITNYLILVNSNKIISINHYIKYY
jgi:hypothetical protein